MTSDKNNWKVGDTLYYRSSVFDYTCTVKKVIPHHGELLVTVHTDTPYESLVDMSDDRIVKYCKGQK